MCLFMSLFCNPPYHYALHGSNGYASSHIHKGLLGISRDSVHIMIQGEPCILKNVKTLYE